MEIKLPKLECLRCGWQWTPRSETPPKVCPNLKCHSPWWNIPKNKIKSFSPRKTLI